MVEGKLKNIDELEEEERASSINPDDFLFDVSSEQIEVPLNFDFSGLVDVTGVDGTAAEAASSSQGS